MNPTKGLTLIKVLFLALLATVASAGLLSAEDYKGKFTLPVETKWGTATLPAGDYEFKLNTNVAPYTIKVSGVSGKDGAVFIFAAGVSDASAPGQSTLIIVRRGRNGTVRAFHLAKEGLVFTYGAPKGELLLAEGPQLIQRIPVLIAHK